MRGSGYGTLTDIIVGIAGAMLGAFLMRALGFAGQGGLTYIIVIAILSAIILTSIVRLLSKNFSKEICSLRRRVPSNLAFLLPQRVKQAV